MQMDANRHSNNVRCGVHELRELLFGIRWRYLHYYDSRHQYYLMANGESEPILSVGGVEVESHLVNQVSQFRSKIFLPADV